MDIKVKVTLCKSYHVCGVGVKEPAWSCALVYNNTELFPSSQDECYNYIKVLVPRNDETLFACGTNAFNPTCRNYKVGYCTAVRRLPASITASGSCPSYNEMLYVWERLGKLSQLHLLFAMRHYCCFICVKMPL